jgi:hypothetical protein
MSEKLQRFQARARELARCGKFNGWRPIAFELQFEEGFTDAIQWTYSPSSQEELDIICRESRKFSPLTGWPLGKGGRSMAYAVGGILLLAGVVFYAAVETRFELRRDQQQIEKTERGSGADHLATLSQ